jgi:hypothetical protein
VTYNRYFLQSCLLLFIVSFPLGAFEGSMNYEKFYRLNTPLYRSDSGDLINFSLESHALEKTKKFDYFYSGDVRLYFQDNNALNYSLQEAYVRYIGDDYKLYLGRKILDWNPNEKYWSLGYLNANQAFTLLSTEEEGVTGLVYNKEIGPFEFDVLLSYAFIPQINPAVDFKNGEIIRRSDWAKPLPKDAVVTNGTVLPLYYNQPNYDVSKILLNKSLGGNVMYKWRNGGIAAFAVYKPENQLRINASASVASTNDKVLIDLEPTVNHHAYYGLQLIQDFGDVKTRGGLSYVDPNARLGRDFPISIDNARKSNPFKYLTLDPSYEKESYSHFSVNLDRKIYKLSLNYIHLLSGNVRRPDDFFSETVKWKRAFGGTATVYFTDAFSIMADLKYDLVRFDNILKSEIKYNYNNQVNISLGLEILKAPTENSYWKNYRANDLLYSSIGFYY